NPTQEPSAVVPLARICAGGGPSLRAKGRPYRDPRDNLGRIDIQLVGEFDRTHATSNLQRPLSVNSAIRRFVYVVSYRPRRAGILRRLAVAATGSLGASGSADLRE